MAEVSTVPFSLDASKSVDQVVAHVRLYTGGCARFMNRMTGGILSYARGTHVISGILINFALAKENAGVGEGITIFVVVREITAG